MNLDNSRKGRLAGYFIWSGLLLATVGSCVMVASLPETDEMKSRKAQQAKEEQARDAERDKFFSNDYRKLHFFEQLAEQLDRLDVDLLMWVPGYKIKIGTTNQLTADRLAREFCQETFTRKNNLALGLTTWKVRVYLVDGTLASECRINAEMSEADLERTKSGDVPSTPATTAAQKKDILYRASLAHNRDMFWLEKKLDKESPGWRRSIQPDLDKEKIPVDENLTAEKVFANEACNDNVHPLAELWDLSDKPSKCNARQLSEYEKTRLSGLRRIHKMAGLKLFNDRCGPHPYYRVKLIDTQFGKLPTDAQEKALAHEIKGIESRQPWSSGGTTIPAGWAWFCDIQLDNLKKDYGSEILQTAAEGYFPVSEEDETSIEARR